MEAGERRKVDLDTKVLATFVASNLTCQMVVTFWRFHVVDVQGLYVQGVHVSDSDSLDLKPI